jgi:hypothetical protein
LRARRQIGTAFFAGPEAGPFRFRSTRVKSDILTTRRPRRAGRPAVDARRFHGKEKVLVRSRITPLHGLPFRAIRGERKRQCF